MQKLRLLFVCMMPLLSGFSVFSTPPANAVEITLDDGDAVFHFNNSLADSRSKNLGSWMCFGHEFTSGKLFDSVHLHGDNSYL